MVDNNKGTKVPLLVKQPKGRLSPPLNLFPRGRKHELKKLTDTTTAVGGAPRGEGLGAMDDMV